MGILGLIAWSIFGLYGTYMITRNLYGEKSKVNFSPEQLGGLVMLPLGGALTFIIALLIENKVIDLATFKGE